MIGREPDVDGQVTVTWRSADGEVETTTSSDVIAVRAGSG